MNAHHVQKEQKPSRVGLVEPGHHQVAPIYDRAFTLIICHQSTDIGVQSLSCRQLPKCALLRFSERIIEVF